MHFARALTLGAALAGTLRGGCASICACPAPDAGDSGLSLMAADGALIPYRWLDGTVSACTIAQVQQGCQSIGLPGGPLEPPEVAVPSATS